MPALPAHLRFFADYVKTNFQVALEYRVSFIAQIVGMIINDGMWVAFWWIYFTRFPVLSGGWTVNDVMALWAVTAVGVGLTVGFFGNSLRLAQMIAQGELDYYLALPKNVLLHILVSSMNITGWGDVLFGSGLFIFFLHPAPERIALFLLLALCSATVFLAFNIFWQSLAFWLGSAEGLAFQLWGALITFSTYPPPLFQGFVRGLLFTVLPAAFMSHLPVELLRHFDPALLLLEIGVAAGALALSIFCFYRGLRRYESGNLLVARS